MYLFKVSTSYISLIWTNNRHTVIRTRFYSVENSRSISGIQPRVQHFLQGANVNGNGVIEMGSVERHLVEKMIINKVCTINDLQNVIDISV